MIWLYGITDAMDMNSGKLQEMVRDRGGVACCCPWGHKQSDVTGQLNNSKQSECKSVLKIESSTQI